MRLLKLAWKNIVNKPLNLLLSIILFGLGVGLIGFLMQFDDQLKEKFTANLADIDLVIGAKGSPLQLILSNMYHIDNPTGNIDIKDAKPFLNPKHPLLKQVVPLSLGDNYRNFRIVGTNHEIISLYKGEIESGKLWTNDLEVTIGRQVADATGLRLGDSFTSSHGFAEDEDLAHEHSKFKVVGILQPTGSVLDQLILCTTSSIWAVHDHSDDDHEEHDHSGDNHDDHAGHEHDDHDGHDHEGHNHDDHEGHDHEGHNHDDHAGHDHDDHEGHDHEGHNHDDHAGHDHAHDNSNADLLNHPDKQITAMLVRYKSKTNFQSLSMPRNINENTNMQAASPAYEINKLRNMVGVGTDAVRSIALLIALVSAISIFISLFRSLKERKYELSIMRVLGGKRSTLFILIILEGLILAFIGWIIGTVLSHVGMEIMSNYIHEDFRYNFTGWRWMSSEWWILLASLVVGFIASLIPALQAARTDINTTLSSSGN